MNFSNHGLIIPDVSFYQDDNSTLQKIDFAKMKAAGAVGVICRAGQNNWIDPDFKDYWQAAKVAGLPRGSYWFFDSRSSPGTQANIWRAQIGNDLPELGFYTDLEESYKGLFVGEKNWEQLILAMEAFYPDSIHGVYTADWWWSSQAVRDLLFWSRRPLWVSRFEVGQAAVILPAPWRGGEAVFWQFTASGDGAKYGVESKEIDLSYFNGDANKFQSFFGLSGETDAPQEEGTMVIYQGTVLATEPLRVREGPGTTYDIITTVKYGDKLEASNIVEGWWHLTKVNGVAIDGFSFSNNGAYIKTDAVISDYPPTEEPDTITLHYPSGVTKKYTLTYVPE